VPIFWSEALAVQTAAGKRRKLLFFREGDLQACLLLLLAADCRLPTILAILATGYTGYTGY
jgi:hypothetical protein